MCCDVYNRKNQSNLCVAMCRKLNENTAEIFINKPKQSRNGISSIALIWMGNNLGFVLVAGYYNSGSKLFCNFISLGFYCNDLETFAWAIHISKPFPNGDSIKEGYTDIQCQLLDNDANYPFNSIDNVDYS